jgi:hydrogenase-4 component B
MTSILAAVCLLLVGAVSTLLVGKRLSPLLGALSATGSAVLLLHGALPVVLGGGEQRLTLDLALPLGACSLALDPLSAWFVVPLAVVGALAAVYGASYLPRHDPERHLGPSFFFYLLLLAVIALVLLAADAFVFLVCWELMALASLILVMHDSHEPAVQRAGLIYLVASHLGALVLVLAFALLVSHTGSFAFSDMARAAPPAKLANLLFVLFLVGFGAKAGIVPFHIWLPEAHPAAPAHVSALLSAVLIKTGLYGLLRVLSFLGSPPFFFGALLVVVGLTTAVVGVLYALAQRDLKRLLAYSSIENIGIIVIGIGMGLLGRTLAEPSLAWLGFAAALLHVANHALMKGLLFLAAGAVADQAGTVNMDRLGGLHRKLPWTAALFLVGAFAICALPPLNGFVSEFLIYFAAYGALMRLPAELALLLLAVIGALALVGGLSLAAFAKAHGITFLGEPRASHASHASREAEPLTMRLPMLLAALAMLALGLFPTPLLRLLTAPVRSLLPGQPPAMPALPNALTHVTYAAFALLALILVLAAVRRRLLAGRRVEESVTWDCGYAAPTSRMQYTATSFSAPFLRPFRLLLRTEIRREGPLGLFPKRASYATSTPDYVLEKAILPCFRWVARSLGAVRHLQRGRVELYVLYVAVTLLLLMLGRLG